MNYGAVHGRWCNASTVPTQCRYCGQRVFYFSCDCGCKVFFDSLGYPWPQHICAGYLKAEYGITVPSQEQRNLDRLAYAFGEGRRKPTPEEMEEFKKPLRRDNEATRPTYYTRDVIACAPYRSKQIAAYIGVIREIVEQVDIYKKLHLPETPTAALQIVKKLGDVNFAQITIYVEDFQSINDLDSYYGYTALVRRDKFSSATLQVGDLVSFCLGSVQILDRKPVWICDDVNLLGR